MNNFCLITILVLAPLVGLMAQTEDLSKSKIIFSVNKQNPYILMDDTLEVKNGKIFDTDTGVHTVQIWAAKHELMDTSFNIITGVHLNRQFFDLKKREDYKKRRNNDIMVACVLGVSAPILFSIDTKFEPYDLKEYEDAIAMAEAEIAGGNSAAITDLQVAQENYQFVQEQNNEEKKKADLKKGIVTGVIVAELAGLSAYLVHRAVGPKLKRKNPLLTDLHISPRLGLNHAGIGLGFKF